MSQIGLLCTQYVQVYGATTLCTGHTPKCAICLVPFALTVLLLLFRDVSACGEFFLLFLGVMIDVDGGGVVDCLPCVDVEVFPVAFFCFFLFSKKH